MSSGNGQMHEAVSVRIPLRPEYLHILRTLAAEMAARMDFSYDAVDDLRLAVDEAGSQLMAAKSESRQLCMKISDDDDRLELVVCTDAPAQPWPPSGLRHTLAWQVLSSLVDEALFTVDGEGSAVRMSKRGVR
ncbi:MAG TPA: ATP-binding protein [Actinomycetota bacterium]|nr:ATP-binding protein [Actinomycetota bacterium]